jgi:hypothetical protein
MSSVLDPVRAAVEAVARVDVGGLSRTELAETVVGLRGLIERFEGEFARLAHRADAERVWADAGATSFAAWLSRSTGTSPGKAKGAAALGEALDKSDALADAVRCGTIGTDTAKEIAAAVDDTGFDEIAAELIGELAGATPRDTERAVDAWRSANDPAATAERRRRALERRCVTFRPIGDGLEHVDAVVPASTARDLRLALTHLAEAQIHDQTGRTHAQRLADALGDLVAAYNRGEVTGGRNVPHLIATMSLEALCAQAGNAIADTGEILSDADIERLCCDATIHRYVADQTSARMNFGRGRRTVSTHQYWALVARDRGCRYPGCDRPPGWTEAHHLDEFTARGGETNIDRLVLGCNTHHHLIHDGGWTLTGTVDHLIFTSPYGEQFHSYLPGTEPHPDTDTHLDPDTDTDTDTDIDIDIDTGAGIDDGDHGQSSFGFDVA